MSNVPCRTSNVFDQTTNRPKLGRLVSWSSKFDIRHGTFDTHQESRILWYPRGYRRPEDHHAIAHRSNPFWNAFALSAGTRSATHLHGCGLSTGRKVHGVQRQLAGPAFGRAPVVAKR